MKNRMWVALCAMLVAICVALSGCCEIVRPAENGPQQSVFFFVPTYDNVAELSVEDLHLAMIAEILPGQRVELVVDDETDWQRYHDALAASYVPSSQLLNLGKIEGYYFEAWPRDNGPAFVWQNTLTNQGQVVVEERIVNFKFDGWGFEPFIELGYYDPDDDVVLQIADALGVPVIDSPLIAEWGNINSNGRGVIAHILSTSLQRLAYSNDPTAPTTWGTTEIINELKRVTGAVKVLTPPYAHPFDGHPVIDGVKWLDGVPYFAPFTVNHVDEIQQFVDHDTMVVAYLPQEDVTNALEQEVHDALHANYLYWTSVTDAEGQPFEVIKMPDPGMIVEYMDSDDTIWVALGDMAGIDPAYDPEGGWIISAASYLNYVVANGVVLVPQFYRDGRDLRLIDTDAEAVSILTGLYSGRRIVPMDAELLDAINLGGGGMHCITQERRALPSAAELSSLSSAWTAHLPLQ